MPESGNITRWGIITFPGSNCDKDALDAVGRICEQQASPVWHRPEQAGPFDALFLPGGFSYGDYLRSGAIARFSSVMEGVVNFAGNNGVVIGICNGFQVLTEAGLLPGALMRNVGLRFICREIHIRVERKDTIFTSRYKIGDVLRIPIAHNEGSYYLPSLELEKLEDEKRVIFRYCDPLGNITPESNPNGSLNNIAGIINAGGNVLGMMPHPERRCDPLLGRADGIGIFQSVIDNLLENRNSPVFRFERRSAG